MGASCAEDGRTEVSQAETGGGELGIRTLRVRNALRMETLRLRMGLPGQEVGGMTSSWAQDREEWSGDGGFSLPYIGQLLMAGPRS